MLKKTRKTTKFFSTRFFGLTVAAIFVLGLVAFNSPSVVAEDASEVNSCKECHEEVALSFAHTRHASNKCSACHGDAARHLEEGGVETIYSFKPADTPNSKSEKCLDCHQDVAGRYFAGSHGKASMSCNDCHKVHKGDKTKHSSKSCIGCHEDVFAEFKLNERHRLQEGILGCTDCHNPHEPAARERLGGFRHEACLKCHINKGGPFIFEHGASRIEGCSACHEVHGSVNRHMLTFQNSGELCFSCHTTSPNWHAYFQAATTNCVSCHSTIHGSHFDRLFLK